MGLMNPCTCGDAEDEHELRRSGPAECLVRDCPCIQFEEDEGDEDA